MTLIEVDTKDLLPGDRIYNYKARSSPWYWNTDVFQNLIVGQPDPVLGPMWTTGLTVGTYWVRWKVERAGASAAIEHVEIDGSELRVGDKIWDYLKQNGKWRTEVDNSGLPLTVTLIDNWVLPLTVTLIDNWVHISYADARIYQGSSDPHISYIPTRVKIAPRAGLAKASDWNGKCARCGRRTYTGFLQVEHEGGACA